MSSDEDGVKDAMTSGELLKSKRESMGLSQSDAAAKLGVRYVTTWIRWEKDKTPPNLYWAQRLEEEFGVPMGSWPTKRPRERKSGPQGAILVKPKRSRKKAVGEGW